MQINIFFLHFSGVEAYPEDGWQPWHVWRRPPEDEHGWR